ncbi:MAG: hypothetical protein ACC608_09480 [Anaerofustis sp.]
MLKEAIEKIISLSAPNIIDRCGNEFSDKKLTLIESPLIEPVEINTLSGFVSAIKKEIATEDLLLPIMVHIADHASVYARCAANPTERTREIPFIAKAQFVGFNFGLKMDIESMIIGLKSRFIQTDERDALIKCIGSITEENSATASDDGISQNVTVKTGVALKEDLKINPIVKLAPYRTFIELNQPESEFLIRLSEGLQAALYEADGGAWKIAARKNIGAFLALELAEEIASGKVYIAE